VRVEGYACRSAMTTCTTCWPWSRCSARSSPGRFIARWSWQRMARHRGRLGTAGVGG